MRRVPLREVAHARSGDKGDISNIVVVARRPDLYPILAAQLTAESVKRHFGELVRGTIDRYELPRVSALNFVMHGALGGGVTRSLAQDAHGKTRSSLLLTMEVECSEQQLPRLGTDLETHAIGDIDQRPGVQSLHTSIDRH